VNRIAQLADEADIAALHSNLVAYVPQAIEEAVRVQQIPAPTFAESERAAYVQQRFAELGLSDVHTDSVFNVFGRLRGTDPNAPAVLVAAHTDTVFEVATPLDIKRVDTQIYGPGIGDNSLGVASVLAAAELMRDMRFPADIWFVANSREEGMGDLGGIRAVYQALSAQLGCAIIVEGMAFGRVYHSGIAVRRLKISCHTGGGHSWLHFGKPSAIHTLMRIGAEIAALNVPENPRTTYNIGVIEGGQSVNSIAADASLLLDLRSEQRDAVMALEQQVMAIVNKYRTAEMDIQVEVVGDRPSGAIPTSHPFVQLTRDVLQHLNTVAVYETGSTDANVPLAAGLPTVTIGITYGGNAHRLDEYIDTTQIKNGLWQLLLLTAAAAKGYAI
jgi:tripeptide aminopeptidase